MNSEDIIIFHYPHRKNQWKINEWYQYYKKDIHNLFEIMIQGIYKMDKKQKINRNKLFNKFVYFLFETSSKTKSEFIKYDSAEYFRNLNNNDDYSDNDN